MHLYSESLGSESASPGLTAGFQRLYMLICTWQQPALLELNIEATNNSHEYTLEEEYHLH